MNKTKEEILNKIKTGEVKMRPRWEFTAIRWAEIGIWLASLGVALAAMIFLGQFMRLYDPRELAVFGDLGWQIFYEDFPYQWLAGSIVCIVGGTIIWMRTGNNYRKSWQKYLLVSLLVIGLLTIGVLSRDF